MWTHWSRRLLVLWSGGLRRFPAKLKTYVGSVPSYSLGGVYLDRELYHGCLSRLSCKWLQVQCCGLTKRCGTDHSAQKTQKMLTDPKQFDEVFQELISFLVNDELKDPETSDASRWFKEVLEYNVPHGKKNRGMFVLIAYKYLVQQPNEDHIKIARILGWCVELFQASMLVEDDIMDQSYTRRGQPCWFKRENVGLKAVNDASYIESCIYKILRHYLRDKQNYINIIDTFHETTHCTLTGQCLDMTVSPPTGVVDFSGYTIEKYNAIAKWKTAFSTFYQPLAIAMYMNDYLDCYGDEAVTGKRGTDIQDNKCSWLVVRALQKATPEQIVLLKENYGSSDETKVVKVKALFKELELEQEFRDFEEESFQEILELIEKHSGDLPKDMFKEFVQRIYKRNL